MLKFLWRVRTQIHHYRQYIADLNVALEILESKIDDKETDLTVLQLENDRQARLIARLRQELENRPPWNT